MFVRFGSVIVNTERVTHLFTSKDGEKYEIIVVFDNGKKKTVAFPTKQELEDTLMDCTRMLNDQLSM